MSDLIERYVQEVGRYVPQKERADIQAELRSQIHDQLEDRYEGAPTTENVAEVLRELGDPRRMATSYGGEQYLVGPDLYPFMINILHRGWVVVPPIVVIVHVVLALLGSDPVTIGSLVWRAAAGVFQALWIFSAVVVIIFVILQHSGEDLDELTGRDKAFNPYDLPEADDPAGVDRYESSFGVAISAFVILLLLYFLRVGGLTVFFSINGTSGSEIIPASSMWIALLILNTAGLLALNLLALWRKRWTVGLLLAQTALEVFGAVCLYYAIILPVFGWLTETIPGMLNIPFVERLPAVFLAASLLIALVGGLTKVVKLWNYRPGSRAGAAKTA